MSTIDERSLLAAWREDDAELRVPDTPLGRAIVQAVDENQRLMDIIHDALSARREPLHGRFEDMSDLVTKIRTILKDAAADDRQSA